MPASGGEGYFALAMEWLLWREIRSLSGGPYWGAFRPFETIVTRLGPTALDPELPFRVGSMNGW